MLNSARVAGEGLRVLPRLERQIRRLALLGTRGDRTFALLGALLDVLGHRVKGALILHGGRVVGIAEELLVRVFLEQVPSLVVVRERARPVRLTELEPLLTARLAQVVALLELLELLAVGLLGLVEALTLVHLLLDLGLLLCPLRRPLRLLGRRLLADLLLLLDRHLVELVDVDAAVGQTLDRLVDVLHLGQEIAEVLFVVVVATGHRGSSFVHGGRCIEAMSFTKALGKLRRCNRRNANVYGLSAFGCTADGRSVAPRRCELSVVFLHNEMRAAPVSPLQGARGTDHGDASRQAPARARWLDGLLERPARAQGGAHHRRRRPNGCAARHP